MADRGGNSSALLAAVAALSLVACAADKPPIIIGVSLPFTGAREVQATVARHGYETWAAIVNDSGGLLGRRVEFVFRDNANDPDVAAADYETLIVDDQVDLVFGTVSSGLVIPTSQVAADHGYAYPEPAGGSPAVFNRGLTNIFFCQPAPGADQGIPFAAYVTGLAQGVKPNTYAVVTSTESFQLGVVATLTALLDADGMTQTYYQEYALTANPSPADFATVASDLAALDPDMLIGGTSYVDALAQIPAYQAAGYQPRGAFFTSAPSFPSFGTELGSAAEGVFSGISWFPQSDDFQNAEFVARYVELFGGTAEDVAEDAANAFTVGQVAEQAAENINSIDNTALIAELHRGTFQTVVGPLSFDADGRPQGSFMILQWQNGGFIIVAPQNRAQATAIWPKPNW